MRGRVLSNLLKRRVLLILILVFAILGGSVVYAQAGKITTSYRTSTVTYGTITQTIGMAGNLSPVREADLNFPSSGTVLSVEAKVGETVRTHAILAELDPTILAAQLLQAQATVSSAESKLAQDEAGPTAQNLASAENPVSSGEVAVNSDKTSLADTKKINAQSVTAAQTVVTQDTAAVAANCPSLPACAQDEATLATDQQALTSTKVKAQQSNDQSAAQLASAEQQLAAAKSSLAALLASSTSAPTVQIDQAQIEIDQVNVNTLQHQLDGAKMTTPIGGVVAQVNILAGQSVSGGSGTGSSATYAVVVYAPGSYNVTGTVSDAEVNLVAIGQTAEVTPAGSTQALLGKISAISPEATISSGVATFSVTAQLSGTSNSIKPGISATVSIIVNQVVHVLTVPTGAVHTSAAGSTVQILVNGAPRSVVVQTGASDPTRTQILSGLQLNQVVVIAVVTSSVPTSSSGAGTVLGAGGGGRTGGGGAFGGGGAGG
jgi:macrolide-specific efflux system membrane fusion protein